MANDHGQLLRRDVVSTDGADLGQVADIYVDARTGDPRWLVVQGGLLSSTVSFVPAEGSLEDGEGRVVVPHSRRRVRRGPPAGAAGDLTIDEEEALARHYAAAAPGRGDDRDDPAWLADPTTSSEHSLVRAEEEVAV